MFSVQRISNEPNKQAKSLLPVTRLGGRGCCYTNVSLRYTKPKITHCFLRFASTYSGWVCVRVCVRLFCLRITSAIDYVCAIRKILVQAAIWILRIVPAVRSSDIVLVFQNWTEFLSWVFCFVVVASAVLLDDVVVERPERDLVLLSCFHSSLCEFNTSHGHTCCTRSED